MEPSTSKDTAYYSNYYNPDHGHNNDEDESGPSEEKKPRLTPSNDSEQGLNLHTLPDTLQRRIYWYLALSELRGMSYVSKSPRKNIVAMLADSCGYFSPQHPYTIHMHTTSKNPISATNKKRLAFAEAFGIPHLCIEGEKCGVSEGIIDYLNTESLKLKTLNIRAERMNVYGFNALCSFTKGPKLLTDVTLDVSNVPPNHRSIVLKYLSICANLKHIDIRLRGIQDELKEILLQCKKLTDIKLLYLWSSEELQSALEEYLPLSTSVKSIFITMYNNFHVPYDAEHKIGIAIKKLFCNEVQNLTCIKLRNCAIRDEVVKFICECPDRKIRHKIEIEPGRHGDRVHCFYVDQAT